MRYISIEEAEPGMCLAYDLYDSMGRTVIGRGCELTATYISRLAEYGFSGVYIDDELSGDIHVEPSISEALRTEGMKCIEACDIDKCAQIAERIIEELLAKKKVSLDMADLRSYDDYTYAHSVNVAVLCCVIGMGLELSERDLNYLVTAALLHDLGKLFIPKEILNKPGRLTPEEYETMKTHARKSYELLSDRWDISAHVKQTVLFHHENVDGSGYPKGITGAEQSIFVRVLHVADVYDALTSKRPYKKPYSPYEAAEYLMGACGIMFDKQVVQVFLQYVPLYPKGTRVVLSDGREALIYENAGVHNLRPILLLKDGTKLDLLEYSSFSITIVPPEGQEMGSPQKDEADRAKMLEKRRKLLIVDDSKENLEALRDILQPYYSLTLCKSGEQALGFLSRKKFPELIIMDIEMPVMSGIQAAIQANMLTGGTVPILFVSDVGDTETVKICRELKAGGYILRPYQPVFVKSEIERILDGWR